MVCLLCLSSFLFLALLTGCDKKEQSQLSKIDITMLDVGQGLSIVIQDEDHTMIYDGGGRNSSEYVVSWLKSHEITSLDYVIASHYDEDHIAGLHGVLSTQEVKHFLRPDYEAETEIYQSLLKRIGQNGCETIFPQRGDTFSFGNAEFTILAPAAYEEVDSGKADSGEGGKNGKAAASMENNNSLAIRLTYGDFSCVITGDAQEASEKEMLKSKLELDSDLYVAGHHGSSGSSTKKFLKAVSPAYTMISCGRDNTYGHPDEATLKRLKACGTKLFRSDEQGEITLTYDAKRNKITATREPTENWLPGYLFRSEEKKTEQLIDAEEDTGIHDYVVNKNSGVFHKPTCGSIEQMSEKNKIFFTGTREEIMKLNLDNGKEVHPCKNCRP